MRAVTENRLENGSVFARHIDLCLGCRACETVCPSGVPYGNLLEAARAEVVRQRRKRRSPLEAITRVVLTQLFTRPRLLKIGMALARAARDGGFAELAFASGLFAGRLRLAIALLLATRPPASLPGEAVRPGKGKSLSRPAPLKVATLSGCVMEGLFARTNRATERVLERNGCEIVETRGQVCCGALHAHAGLIDSARALAKTNIDLFLQSRCDRIVVNAAGCGAALKEYPHLLSDSEYADRARSFSSKVRDVMELLDEVGCSRSELAERRKVAYDAPCHLLHAQHVAEPPLDAMRTVGGITLVALRGSESCCGGAGIYNLLHPELSADILDEKIDSIIESGADTVATGNPGCLMQIRAGLLMRGVDVAVVHPVDLLDAAR
jgi:glycolate oxidase iron-sulfur subunit